MSKYCIRGKSILPNAGKFILRLTLAIVIWPHGAQKVLGWYGGGGFSATYSAFVDKMGIWGPLAVATILTEFFAPFFLVTGLLTRLSALALLVVMSVAMTFNWSNGFFMNWYGTQKGEGIEYQLLYMGGALALILMGSGRFSLDHMFMKKLFRRHDKI